MNKIDLQKVKLNKFYIFISVVFILALFSILLLHSKIFLGINKLTAEATFNNDTQFLRQLHNISLGYPFYSSEDQSSLIVLNEESIDLDISVANNALPISFNTELLPKDLQVKVVSQTGEGIKTETYIVKNNEKRKIDSSIALSTFPKMEVNMVGTAEKIQLLSQLDEYFNQMFTDSFDESVVLDELTLLPIDSIQTSHANSVVNFGLAKILYPACNYYIELPFGLHWKTQTYYLNNIGDITQYECSPEVHGVYPEKVRLATCEDCSLFRIDKTTFLPSDYEPSTKSLQDFVGGGEIDKKAYADTEEFYNASVAAGFKTNITSSYRSYERQQVVFKYWVDREKSLFGKSQEDAEISANTYSARPGFSEHQLGTTIDLNSVTCTGFDGFCSSNEDIWAWLNEHSWEYGFIRSYPDNKQSETGYVSEDWHFRWLGKDVAKEYIETSNGQTLNVWLEERYLKSFADQR